MKKLQILIILLTFGSGVGAHELSMYSVDEISITNEECKSRAIDFFNNVGIQSSNIKTHKKSVEAKQNKFESYIVCRAEKDLVYMAVSAPPEQQSIEFISGFFNTFKN